MSKQKRNLVFIIVFATLLTACGTKTQAPTKEGTKKEEKLIMATEAGFAPYEYTEDGETVVGVDVDIANEIAKDMGRELEIQNMTFDGALLAVQQGKVDFAAAGVSVTDKRKEKMDFTVEYAVSKNVIVVNKDAGVVNSAKDLTKDKVVGVQLGNVADFYVTDELECEVKQYKKFLEAAQELKNNKIDCIVMDSLPAQQMVAANKELSILEEELFTDKYAIAVKKGNKEMLNSINKVLQRLMDEGKVEEFTIKHTTK